jgi:hypothetical protein
MKFRFCSEMRDAPYDRALALASEVRTMRDHFLEVNCGCGARRVIALGQMARSATWATATLAHVALRVSCHGCHTGPTGVHLTATTHGLVGAPHGPDAVWSIPLVERPNAGAFHRRQRMDGRL